MITQLHFSLAVHFVSALVCLAAEGDFTSASGRELPPGWSWVREHPEFWRINDGKLEVRVEPGNMWGGANNARNVLIREAPDPREETVEVSVQVENRPTEQYEQVNLVWYYDDSHMVKLGQELVDGQLSIVMGREENDRARTIAIIPLESFSVRLRFTVKGNAIHGEFRTPNAEAWREAGACDLPTPKQGAVKAKVSLQFYQGPATAEHWARVSDFRMSAKSN